MSTRKDTLPVQNVNGSRQYPVYKIQASSNVYLVMGKEPVIIDTGERRYRNEIQETLSTLCDLSSIQSVFCTHLHFDHAGNCDLFPNARIYAHSHEISAFRKDPYQAVLDRLTADALKLRTVRALDHIERFRVIHTPGHTGGSVCLHDPDLRCVFTGDSYFRDGLYGRTDLPTSVPDRMDSTLKKIGPYLRPSNYICPGHDY